MVNIRSNGSLRHENTSQPPLQLFRHPHSSSFLLLSDPESAADFLPFPRAMRVCCPGRASCVDSLPPSALHRSPQGSCQCVAPPSQAWSLPESAEGHPYAPKGLGLLSEGEAGLTLSLDALRKATVAFLNEMERAPSHAWTAPCQGFQ